MSGEDFVLYIDGKTVKVSKEVYREYYRAENKEHYFMEKLKKGHITVNPDTHEMSFVPSREQSYEQLLEEDWQFLSPEDSVEDMAVKSILMEKLQAVLRQLPNEEMALVEKLFYLEKTEREVARLFKVSQNTIHYRKNKVLEKLKQLLEK